MQASEMTSRGVIMGDAKIGAGTRAVLDRSVADDGAISKAEVERVLDAFFDDLEGCKTPEQVQQLREEALQFLRSAKFTDGSESRTTRLSKNALAVLTGLLGDTRARGLVAARSNVEHGITDLADVRMRVLQDDAQAKARDARMVSAFEVPPKNFDKLK